MSKEFKSFLSYIKEQGEVNPDMGAPLKGYTAEEIIERIGSLMEVLSDDVRFGVPTNSLGRATTYRDANGAIQKIKDIKLEYDNAGDEVRFYCWSIMYKGSWKATQNLRKKIEDAGGFGEELLNMNLRKVINYFTENAEDSDNVGSISISIDSMKVRKEKSSSRSAEGEGEPAPKEGENIKPAEETKPTEI